MAPSETANPRKRKQPPFKPPRPNTNGVSKSTTAARKSNIGSIFSKGTEKSRSKPKGKAASKSKQRPGVREQEPEEDDEEDHEEDDKAKSPVDVDNEAGGEDDEDSDEVEEDDNDNEGGEDADDASDADMMLAEVTHEAAADESAEPAVPIPLLHRLMHHSFKNPEDTKMSTDARACVGKYIEVFIREGIARCAFEVSEKAGAARSDSALGHDDGWLEVDDLERVGGQLVLDF